MKCAVSLVSLLTLIACGGCDGGGRGGGHRPPPKACDALSAPGVWEDVTPPEVRAQLPGPGDCVYGTSAMAADPDDGSTVYLGTCEMGVWKTTDCGATWTHINTGRNGAVLDTGRQWTFAMDPSDHQVLYTNSGYGSMSNGLLKSTNGGVDWDVIFPNDEAHVTGVVEYGFVGNVLLAPGNPDHVIVTFHARCAPPHSEACFAESEDGGVHWTFIEGDPSWNGGEGTRLYFVGNESTLLFGSESNGLWRSTNGGDSWTDLHMTQSHSGGALYRGANGTYYMGGPNGVIRSDDGLDWASIPGSGSLINGITGDGTRIWAARGFPWGPDGSQPYYPFWTANEATDTTWMNMTDGPMIENGGALHYARSHKVLYSSNLHEGFYRVVLP